MTDRLLQVDGIPYMHQRGPHRFWQIKFILDTSERKESYLLPPGTFMVYSYIRISVFRKKVSRNVQLVVITVIRYIKKI